MMASTIANNYLKPQDSLVSIPAMKELCFVPFKPFVLCGSYPMSTERKTPIVIA